MKRLKSSLAAAAVLCLAAALPAWADSSASSASSESSSTSVGSISTSFGKSSDSSSKGDKTAAGDYKVIDVAEAPARPGTVRVRLQAVADGSTEGEFFLYLPQPTAVQARLSAGQVITARARSYGLEFAMARTQKAFFLALDDDWYRELQTHVVRL
jgi:hypothetical protein